MNRPTFDLTFDGTRDLDVLAHIGVGEEFVVRGQVSHSHRAEGSGLRTTEPSEGRDPNLLGGGRTTSSFYGT